MSTLPACGSLSWADVSLQVEDPLDVVLPHKILLKGLMNLIERAIAMGNGRQDQHLSRTDQLQGTAVYRGAAVGIEPPACADGEDKRGLYKRDRIEQVELVSGSVAAWRQTDSATPCGRPGDWNA